MLPKNLSLEKYMIAPIIATKPETELPFHSILGCIPLLIWLIFFPFFINLSTKTKVLEYFMSRIIQNFRNLGTEGEIK